MKLTKEQITYIDDYLKHHKVKYWDIRIELLDHIVTTVEEKLTKGVSFDDAMIEVHKSFGNKMTMFWNSGIEYGIFANGLGYKSLQEDKIKNLHKNYRRLVKQEFITFFKSLNLLIIYGVLIVFFIILYQILPSKTFSILAFSVPVFQLIFLLLNWYKSRSLKKSAILEIAFSQYSFSIFILYNFINFFNFFDIDKSKIALFLLIVTVIQMPITYVNSEVFEKQMFEIKITYNKFIK
jgi:hypothetical protein